jgi:hypothetical protein
VLNALMIAWKGLEVMARMPQNKAKYDALVMAVATGVSVIDWCKSTKVARSTASTWQRDPKFDRDVAAIRRQMLNEAVGKFTGAVGKVADGMIELAESASSEPTKLSAQRAVMENLIQMTEFGEVKKRLDSLEEWRRENERGDSQ